MASSVRTSPHHKSRQTIPRRPIISLRSSESTSFMLASLRVLHIDTCHAPADGPSIEE